MLSPGRSRVHRVRLALRLAAAALPLLVTAGCSVLAGNRVRVTAMEQRTLGVTGQPSVFVETFNGPITVSAGAGDRVEATITKVGAGPTREAAEADLKNVGVTYTQDGDALHIVAARTDRRQAGSSGAEIALKVPAHAVLSLSTSNGEIASTGVTGQVTARSSNGAIEVHEGRGKLDLETTNGNIVVDAADAILGLNSTNGNLRFAGTLQKGKHSIETTNGGIEVKIPAATRFRFDAGTSNGRVTSGFPGLQPSRGKPGSPRLAARVGAASDAEAEIELDLESTNGSISIEPTPPAEAARP